MVETPKNKSILCVFAHPDDESFGPSGAIALLAEQNDVHLVCATRGEAGENHIPDSMQLTGEVREEELRTSAEKLGIKTVTVLNGYPDGTLSNNVYHKLANDISRIIDRTGATILLTFEPGGASGHLDHIAICMICSYLLHKRKDIECVLEYAQLEEISAERGQNYFVFRPPGYKQEQIGMEFDISPALETKLSAIRNHKSQAKDIQTILKMLDEGDKIERFLVKTKDGYITH